LFREDLVLKACRVIQNHSGGDKIRPFVVWNGALGKIFYQRLIKIQFALVDKLQDRVRKNRLAQ